VLSPPYVTGTPKDHVSREQSDSATDKSEVNNMPDEIPHEYPSNIKRIIIPKIIRDTWEDDLEDEEEEQRQDEHENDEDCSRTKANESAGRLRIFFGLP